MLDHCEVETLCSELDVILQCDFLVPCQLIQEKKSLETKKSWNGTSLSKELEYTKTSKASASKASKFESVEKFSG